MVEAGKKLAPGNGRHVGHYAGKGRRHDGVEQLALRFGNLGVGLLVLREPRGGYVRVAPESRELHACFLAQRFELALVGP